MHPKAHFHVRFDVGTDPHASPTSLSSAMDIVAALLLAPRPPVVPLRNY